MAYGVKYELSIFGRFRDIGKKIEIIKKRLYRRSFANDRNGAESGDNKMEFKRRFL